MYIFSKCGRGSKGYSKLCQLEDDSKLRPPAPPPAASPAKAGVFSNPETFQLEQGAAIHVNFPVRLADKLEFLHGGYIVKEFWYSADGERGPFYENAGQEAADIENLEYARLVTVASHVQELAWALLAASFGVAGLCLQTTSAVNLLWASELRDGDWTHFEQLLTFFCSLFVLRLLVRLAWPMIQVRRYYNSHPGDFVVSEVWHERVWTLFGMFVLRMLGVSKFLADAVITLHIRKPNQPMCVFKAQGKRAFIVGFSSKDQYLAERDEGSVGNYVACVLFDLPLCLSLAGLHMLKQASVGFMDRITIVWCAASVVICACALVKLRRARSRFLEYLEEWTGLEHFEEARAAAKRDPPDTSRLFRAFTCYRLRLIHFGMEVPKEVKEEAEARKFKL